MARKTHENGKYVGVSIGATGKYEAHPLTDVLVRQFTLLKKPFVRLIELLCMDQFFTTHLITLTLSLKAPSTFSELS